MTAWSSSINITHLLADIVLELLYQLQHALTTVEFTLSSNPIASRELRSASAPNRPRNNHAQPPALLIPGHWATNSSFPTASIQQPDALCLIANLVDLAIYLELSVSSDLRNRSKATARQIDLPCVYTWPQAIFGIQNNSYVIRSACVDGSGKPTTNTNTTIFIPTCSSKE